METNSFLIREPVSLSSAVLLDLDAFAVALNVPGHRGLSGTQCTMMCTSVASILRHVVPVTRRLQADRLLHLGWQAPEP